MYSDEEWHQEGNLSQMNEPDNGCKTIRNVCTSGNNPFHGGAQTGEISLALLDHGSSQTQTLGEWHFRFCRKLPKDHHVEICSPEVLGMAGVEPNFPSGKKSYSDNCCTSNSRLRILESSDDVALWSMRTTTEVDNNVDQ